MPALIGNLFCTGVVCLYENYLDSTFPANYRNLAFEAYDIVRGNHYVNTKCWGSLHILQNLCTVENNSYLFFSRMPKLSP